MLSLVHFPFGIFEKASGFKIIANDGECLGRSDVLVDDGLQCVFDGQLSALRPINKVVEALFASKIVRSMSVETHRGGQAESLAVGTDLLSFG